jgi:hypothetical protein
MYACTYVLNKACDKEQSKEGHKLQMSESEILRKMFGRVKHDVINLDC